MTPAGPFTLVALLRTREFDGGSRAEQVAQQLETAIAVGLVRRGERFPPERELATQLGVSMVHVRQALAALRDRGVIVTRRGRGGGSIVADVAAVSESEVERRLRERSTVELRDLGDLAGSVDAASARLAAARADDGDLDRLRGLAEVFAQAEGLEALRRADSRFHIGLAVAAQSQRLTAASVQVRGELTPLCWGLADRAGQVDEVRQHHATIVEAVAAADEVRAHEAALAHSEGETALLVEAHLDLVARRPG